MKKLILFTLLLTNLIACSPCNCKEESQSAPYSVDSATIQAEKEKEKQFLRELRDFFCCDNVVTIDGHLYDVTVINHGVYIRSKEFIYTHSSKCKCGQNKPTLRRR